MQQQNGASIALVFYAFLVHAMQAVSSNEQAVVHDARYENRH